MREIAPREISVARPGPWLADTESDEKLYEHVGLDPATYRRLKRRARSEAAPPPTNELAMRDRDAPYAVLRAAGPGPQRSFAGIDYFQPFNFGVSPPDTTAAANAGRVLEATNAGLRLTKDDGTNPLDATLAAFFGEPEFPASFLFDPRILFDRNAVNRRFFVFTLERDSGSRASWLHLAVSRSDRPAALDAASWCRYKIDFRDFRTTPGAEDVGWADFPQVGVGADALLVSTNQIGFSFGSVFAALRVFDKLALENNAAACPTTPMYSFSPFAVSGHFDLALSPVQHYSSPPSWPGHANPAYAVSNETFQSTAYRVWRVSNVASGNPTLDFVTLQGSFYDTAPDAFQAGTAQRLDTLVPWVSEAAGVGGALWATHNTVCNVGGGENESCIRVLRFDTGQSAGGAPTAVLSQEITFGGAEDGVSFWMPGIAVNQFERALVSFHTSSPTASLSVGYTSKALSEATFPIASSATTGTCPTTNGGRRNGDYVPAFTDPDFVNFWVAGERSVPVVPGVADFCGWQTWLTKVRQ